MPSCRNSTGFQKPWITNNINKLPVNAFILKFTPNSNIGIFFRIKLKMKRMMLTLVNQLNLSSQTYTQQTLNDSLSTYHLTKCNKNWTCKDHPHFSNRNPAAKLSELCRKMVQKWSQNWLSLIGEEAYKSQWAMPCLIIVRWKVNLVKLIFFFFFETRYPI